MIRQPSILLRSARLLVMSPTRAVRDGAVLVEGGTVVRVGKTDEVVRAASRCEYDVDCRHSIVIPGLVNCHVHLAQALLRGLVPDDVRLISWLRDYVWPLQGNFTAEDGTAAAELCILEMLRTGTTAFVETHLQPRYGIDGIAEVAIRSGIRAYLAKSFMDVPSYGTFENIIHEGLVETRDECVSEFERLHKRWDGAAGGRIRVWIGLRTPGAVSDELFEEAVELASERDSGIVMHLAEVEEDLDYFRSRGTTPGRFVKRFGLARPKSLFIHCVWLGDEDIEILARASASVCHCPSSNLKLGSGIAPVSKMLEMDLNVTLGTDGGPSNDSYDMVREMKLAAILQKGFLRDVAAMSLRDVLAMATLNGARAVGEEENFGTIEEGKRADIAVFNLRKPHLYPPHDPLSNLVYSGCGHDAEYVIIDGNLVVEGGRVLTLDEEEVLERAAKRAVVLRDKLSLPELWSV